MRRILLAMKMKKRRRQAVAVFLTLSILFLQAFVYVEAEPAGSTHNQPSSSADAKTSEEESYKEYQERLGDQAAGTQEVAVDLMSYIDSSGEVKKRTDIPEQAGEVLFTGEESSVTWKIQVPESGRYQLRITYYTIEGKGSDIGRSVKIDGKSPFEESADLAFGRVWEDDGEVKTDYQGNEIRPNAQEVHTWQTMLVKDASGYYNDAFWYYLSAGEHTLTMTSTREPMVLGTVAFVPPQTLKSYAEYQQQYAGKQSALADCEKIQAENMAYRSAKSIYPTASKSSAAMEPVSTGAEKLNLIDGSKFKLPEQWISWNVEVEQDGFYQIAVRYRQSDRDGAYCSRRLFIDGEQPFAEAAQLQFNYSGQWDVCWLGDGNNNPYQFYLTAGTHELKLQVTIGKMAELVSEVGDILTELNTCYRSIYVITGSEADQYRDYHFTELIPDTLKEMEALNERLKTVLRALQDEMGEKGSFTTAFDNLIFDISAMVGKPRDIASKLETFKSDLGSLGEWQQGAINQPVSFDWIWVKSPQSQLPKANKGFFSTVAYQCMLFANSFVMDYSAIGKMSADADEHAIKVWVTSGRDQSKIIRRMIDQDFTPTKNITVDLQLVAAGTLLRSILAGNGPDVAMQLQPTEPMNYALRDAVVNLRDFSDYDDVVSRFNPNALKPFEYLGEVYALPETFSYPMMFYRTDIFKEMGWSVPKTWDDVYELIIQLSAYNMEFGLPFNASSSGAAAGTNTSVYMMMLMQRDIEFYNEDRTAVNTTGDAALQAFNQWLSYYKDYGLSVTYDFSNRFRNGEMPIGISDFVSTYNQLSVFAPEINGQWEFVEVPGTLKADGSVDHTTIAAGTGISILSATKDKNACWEFLKWWTDADAQVNYGTDLESILGAAARYASANIEAVARTPWPVSEYRNIMKQWESADCLPQAPGGYIVSRYIGFAAREVINQSANPGQTMIHYTKLINEELERKKKEFFFND